MFSAPVLWTFGPKLKWWWQKVRRSSKVLPFSMFGTKFQDSQSTKTTQWRHWKSLKSVGFSFLWNTDAFAACMPDVKSPAAFFLPAETFKVKEIHHQISLSSLLKVVIPHWIYEIWDDAQNENVSFPFTTCIQTFDWKVCGRRRLMESRHTGRIKEVGLFN